MASNLLWSSMAAPVTVRPGTVDHQPRRVVERICCAQLAEGSLARGDALVLVAESDQLVCFGDGIEADALSLTWGQRLTVRTVRRRLRLVLG